MKRLLSISACLAVCACALGCSPRIVAISPAPPDRVLELDEAHDRIELSEGVGVGFECYRDGSSCREPRAVTLDGAIAHVYPAHLAHVDFSWGYAPQRTATGFVLVAMSPGKTTLRVQSEGWTHDYEVEVLRAPDAQ